MLELINIKKDYPAGSGTVHALRGIDLQFRESDFVAILGPSGCGKTTMLNIIGGLDQYTQGDLKINGRSTKGFKSRDWDSYRNHSIGFVFQNYNLIPHQSVLQNVELALTLSGVSKQERRRRAKEALESVGLGDQLKKRPNEMSGGQMQRVAIARALVNNPDIILADEPTGALDTETSVQVMEILKEVARDRLVIMVTHNPDLAETYATRTIRMLDGKIISDSAPLSKEELSAHRELDKERLAIAKKERKSSMSFATSFMLSLKNLFTKKGRTLLTAFAGSIGIIGIALILALSTGINSYIDQVQQDTLSSYPITIEAETVDMSAMMLTLMANQQDENKQHDLDKVYSSTVMYDLMNSMLNAEVSTNNLKDFKKYLDAGGGGISDLATIIYSYDFDFDFYTKDTDGVIIKSDVMTLMQEAMGAMFGGDYSSFFNSPMGSMYESFDVWQELLPGETSASVGEQVLDQYDLIHGSWPTAYNEVILFVDSNNEISDLMLYALGLISSEEMNETLSNMTQGKQEDAPQLSWTYEDLCGITFKLLLPAEYYQKDSITGTYVDMSKTPAGMDFLYNSSQIGTEMKIVGIARPNVEATSTMVTGAIGYTQALTNYAIESTANMEVVKEQLANPKQDVLLNLPFATGEETEPTEEEIKAAITEHLLALTTAQQAAAYRDVMSQPSSEYVAMVVEQQVGQLSREDVEKMIMDKYAQEMGVDASTVMGYIQEMSDEELFAQVREAAATQVRLQYATAVEKQLSIFSLEQLAGSLLATLSGMEGTQPLTAEQYAYLYENYMPPTVSKSTYEENLKLLGYVDKESPSTIYLYTTTFADKDLIADLIQEYNNGVAEEDQIEYTDYVALLMSSITAIISGISYLLIAFVSISLVVSSIMIGVITLISVQERTKEIGILRAIGASKRNVSRMFNAETLIVGLCAGLVGIGVSLLLTIPINAILLHFTGIAGLKAILPWRGAIVLVIISALLTLIAGIIPSRSAAKKDPVVALRTE
ncbi:MAG: ABC transporter ATP-binding protein/permease [Oscillospiraceae bacterium]|nr:ABC transporter ATP-binding protein/permease [Oscillospiraceae bacterium]